MHHIAEEALAAAKHVDHENLTPIQRLVFHELQEQLRLALDEIAELSIRIVCQDEKLKERTVNLEST